MTTFRGSPSSFSYAWAVSNTGAKPPKIAVGPFHVGLLLAIRGSLISAAQAASRVALSGHSI